MREVCVVVPVYKEKLSVSEEEAVDRTVRVLHSRDIFFVTLTAWIVLIIRRDILRQKSKLFIRSILRGFMLIINYFCQSIFISVFQIINIC